MIQNSWTPVLSIAWFLVAHYSLQTTGAWIPLNAFHAAASALRSRPHGAQEYANNLHHHYHHHHEERNRFEDRVIVETWRWCSDFVVPLELCPWAAASVQSKGALRISISTRNEMSEAILQNAMRLHQDVDAQLMDPNVAIVFVVCSDRDWDFVEFYDYFDQLEESWQHDFVTLAPFHPDWQFGGDTPLELGMEKQSPYPTVSLVCTSVIDKAGEAATNQIGQHNEEVLLKLGLDKLQRLYQKAVFAKDSPS